LHIAVKGSYGQSLAEQKALKKLAATGHQKGALFGGFHTSEITVRPQVVAPRDHGAGNGCVVLHRVQHVVCVLQKVAMPICQGRPTTTASGHKCQALIAAPANVNALEGR
jgi:hypothetical protein